VALEKVTGAEQPIRAVIEVLGQCGVDDLRVLCEE